MAAPRSLVLTGAMLLAGCVLISSIGSTFVSAPRAAPAPTAASAAASAVLLGAGLASVPTGAQALEQLDQDARLLQGIGVCTSLCLFLVGIIIAQARKSVENGWLK